VGKLYGLRDYGGMIADQVRMSAHRAALARVIRPGSVVVDLGAGIGIMSLIACQLGARRVFAIEPNDLAEVAREVAAANGFADRIQIVQDFSDRVHLPEPADVLVSDLRGKLPFYSSHIPTLVDARRRFLAPGGVVIPESDRVRVAVVSAPQAYARSRAPWADGAEGLDMSAAERVAVNQLASVKIAPDEVITPARTWASIDYRREPSPSTEGSASWVVDRPAVGHGLRVWFDTTLAPGIEFSNAADAPETIYGAVFFPWLEPVALAPGDEIAVRLAADLVGKDYVWRWTTTVTGGGGSAKARFRQSSFLGEPLSAESLRLRRPDRATRLNDEGRVAAFVLGEMGRERVLGDIARDLAARFPGMFPDEAAALAEAAGLSRRFGA
jgi:protein arginine N-methyltransferase 1